MNAKKTDIKLEQISDRTNIALKSLQALESGQFEKLPGKFYFRNYIKSYLKAVGSDMDTFFKDYGEMVDSISSQKVEEEETTNVYYSKLRYARFKKRSFVFTLVIFLVLVILAVLFFFTGTGKSLLFGKGGDSNGNGETGSIAAENTGMTGIAIPEHKWKLPNTSGQVTPDYYPVRVEVSFLQNCWFQAYRGNRKVEEKVFKSGEKAAFNGYRIRLAVGNPSGVKLTINDREVTYLKSLARSERLDITPATIEGIFKK